MAEKISETNIASIAGTIVSDFRFSHEIFGEKFYIIDVKAERSSGYEDIIPVLVSERLTDINEDPAGTPIIADGEFRSYNKHENGRNRLMLSLFAREIQFPDEDETESMSRIGNNNHVELEGYVCKDPVFRKTPLGREITDVLVAVNRAYGKSDYIPCICWGRNAKFVSTLPVGSRIRIKGRMQSRPYMKKISESEVESRMAYEVSVSVVESVEESDSGKE